MEWIIQRCRDLNWIELPKRVETRQGMTKRVSRLFDTKSRQFPVCPLPWEAIHQLIVWRTWLQGSVLAELRAALDEIDRCEKWRQRPFAGHRSGERGRVTGARDSAAETESAR